MSSLAVRKLCRARAVSAARGLKRHRLEAVLPLVRRGQRKPGPWPRQRAAATPFRRGTMILANSIPGIPYPQTLCCGCSRGVAAGSLKAGDAPTPKRGSRQPGQRRTHHRLKERGRCDTAAGLSDLPSLPADTRDNTFARHRRAKEATGRRGTRTLPAPRPTGTKTAGGSGETEASGSNLKTSAPAPPVVVAVVSTRTAPPRSRGRRVPRVAAQLSLPQGLADRIAEAENRISGYRACCKHLHFRPARLAPHPLPDETAQQAHHDGPTGDRERYQEPR